MAAKLPKPPSAGVLPARSRPAGGPLTEDRLEEDAVSRPWGAPAPLLLPLAVSELTRRRMKLLRRLVNDEMLPVLPRRTPPAVPPARERASTLEALAPDAERPR